MLACLCLFVCGCLFVCVFVCVFVRVFGCVSMLFVCFLGGPLCLCVIVLFVLGCFVYLFDVLRVCMFVLIVCLRVCPFACLFVCLFALCLFCSSVCMFVCRGVFVCLSCGCLGLLACV